MSENNQREPPLRRDGKPARKSLAVMRARAEARRSRRARRWKWLLVGRWVLGLLPVGLAAALGHVVGTLLHYLVPWIRRRIRENLATAYGDRLSPGERARVGRRCLALMARGLLAYVSMHRRGPERSLTRLEVVGVENLEAALAGGKGCLVGAFHFGLFELGAAHIGNHHRGKAVGRDARGQEVGVLVTQMREDMGCPTIERGEPRELLRALKENRPVAIVVDHDLRRVNGVFVPFFGKPAHTAVGAAALSARVGAPIVPGFVEWTGLGTHRLTYHPPMWVRDDLDRAEAAAELTHRITAFGEAEIRRRPDHWMWIHRRWATRPEDRPEQIFWPPEIDPGPGAAPSIAQEEAPPVPAPEKPGDDGG